MMNFQEFQTVITPIIQRWPRGYSGDQLQLVHDEMKMVSRSNFERVVRHLLGASRVAPMVPDFRKAVNDLSIRPEQTAYVSPDARPIVEEDFVYQIRGEVWANNAYVFIRADKVKDCKFIFKKENPTHPLVIEDSQVRHQRISQIKKEIANGTYGKMHPATRTDMRPVQFNMEVPSDS